MVYQGGGGGGEWGEGDRCRVMFLSFNKSSEGKLNLGVENSRAPTLLINTGTIGQSLQMFDSG